MSEVAVNEVDLQTTLKIYASMKEEAMVNCPYFVERFVYIEDKDSEEIAVRFNLWERQKEALNTVLTHRFIVALKARQLGITWLALAYAIWLMLKPGKMVLALSKTEEDAKELVRRAVFILRHLPPWFLIQSNVPSKDQITYDNTASTITIYHPNGEPSVFKSFPAGENSGAGFTGNLLILDEWALQQYAREIWQAAFPTINRPTGGQVWGISTMRINTLFDEISRGAEVGTNDFVEIFLPWDTDPRRDQAWYERTKRQMGEAAMVREYPATPEEARSQAFGAFFSEVQAHTHLKQPLGEIPEHYRRYAALDYGLDMLAVIWVYIDGDGYCRVYRELAKPDLTIKEAAAAVTLANQGDKLSGIFAPPDMWNRQRETRTSFAATFANYGMFLTRSDARREHGWEAVKSLLLPIETRHPQTGEPYMTARLTIDQGAAPVLWKCLTEIQRDETNYNDVSDKDHSMTHHVDALRYFATGRSLKAITPGMASANRQTVHNPIGDTEEETRGDFITW